MVFILMYMPYGAPAHDVDVLGVYSSESMALDAKESFADEYDRDELVIIEKEFAYA